MPRLLFFKIEPNLQVILKPRPPASSDAVVGTGLGRRVQLGRSFTRACLPKVRHEVGAQGVPQQVACVRYCVPPAGHRCRIGDAGPPGFTAGSTQIDMLQLSFDKKHTLDFLCCFSYMIQEILAIVEEQSWCSSVTAMQKESMLASPR